MSGLCSNIILKIVAVEDTLVRLSMLLLKKIDGGSWRLIYIMETSPSLCHHPRRSLWVTRNKHDRDHDRDAQMVPILVKITSFAVFGSRKLSSSRFERVSSQKPATTQTTQL